MQEEYPPISGLATKEAPFYLNKNSIFFRQQEVLANLDRISDKTKESLTSLFNYFWNLSYEEGQRASMMFFSPLINSVLKTESAEQICADKQ